MEAFKVIPGTVQSCANILKEGHVLAIAPGGVYEAQFGNSNYPRDRICSLNTNI